jgi:predicted transcriptional regulator
MRQPKAMTIRLSADQAEALETVASVDNMAVVDVIRAAISEHVEARTQDAEFQRSLRERLERVQAMLRP